LSDPSLDTRGFLAGRVTVRKLPVIHGRPERPVTDGGRILLPAGEFAQIANDESVRFVAYLEFKHEPGLSRGNHYHRRKAESLYVISGRLRARFADPHTQDRAEITIEAGDLVRVSADCAHAYEALEPSHAVEFSGTAFDATDVVAFAF
jgi:mannose-6-phosphate isomerase-like protein (cupin superfamily)